MMMNFAKTGKEHIISELRGALHLPGQQTVSLETMQQTIMAAVACQTIGFSENAQQKLENFAD